MLEGPGMQNWNKGPGNTTAAISVNQEDTRWFRQEGFQTRVREASSWGVQRVVEGEKLDLVEGSSPSGVKNQEPDTVKGSDPSETAEETIHVFSIRGAGDVRALTTWDSFAPTVGGKKTLDVGGAPGLTETLSGSCSG
jgi:hypothetical protein